MPTKKAKKNVRYVAVVDLPPLPYEAYAALRQNIAANGILVPILTARAGANKKFIIDGSIRKAIADELGYDCPEIEQDGLSRDEMRMMARALNLARRQLDREGKRQIVAQQILECPNRSSCWIGKMLGVHHATVASVRAELESSGQIDYCSHLQSSDGRVQPASKPLKAVARSPVERKTRIEAVTLIQGDCRDELKKIPANSIDAIVTDPIYPEIRRAYGRISEEQWHSLMREVVVEARRILKPRGSAVFIFQPNYERIGKMRMWLWEFVAWAGKEWNLIQDVYWWAIDALPVAGTNRKYGLLRHSVKMCVWLGSPDCYRNQDAVLWTASQETSARNRADNALRTYPSGRTYRNSTMTKSADQRGGTTPYNLLPVSNGGQPGSGGDHPATTSYAVAAWWAKYILPPGGALLDPFCGSGTMLAAGLDHDASRVIGIDREKKYLAIARRRVMDG